MWPSSLNLGFVEENYHAYLRDRDSVPADWRAWFDALSGDGDVRSRAVTEPEAPSTPVPDVSALQDRVDQLVRAFRVRGHMVAQVDPLGRPRTPPPELDPTFFGLDESHMELCFSAQTMAGPGCLPLREILRRLRKTYCGSIGVVYMHIGDIEKRRWLQQRLEATENRIRLSRDEQVRILTRLTDAVIFEEFIQRKYLGAKRFSLEGGESLVPLLDMAIERAASQGIKEIVVGMGHRGRLNVLANILGKSPRDIFHEFEDSEPEAYLGHGDVKYHLGYSNDWKAANGQTLHLSLCYNPSHLEFVDPVVLGRTRAKQDRRGDTARASGLSLMIHGDAAFAGQGVVQETLNMSRLAGYVTGGTLHVIVNNQLGFTTGPEEGRSSTHSSDVARMLPVPIFHVNGEDPEAVAQAVTVAMDFRERYQSDVVVDMYCYRRWGHNEGDEPAFTQPLMYQAIASRTSVRDGYLQHLLRLDGLTREEADDIALRRREHLERELSAARGEEYVPLKQAMGGVWQGYQGGPESQVPDVPTGVPLERLSSLLSALTVLPAGFEAHPKIRRFLEGWREMASGSRPLDWAAAEALALASLADVGVRVRLSGQDSVRGTFSQRHAGVWDMRTGERYVPLSRLGPVEIVNSPLSEVGVVGFEYGYSQEMPDALVMWEAQFGDFCNVSQVHIDQFMASGEGKWQRLSGLVLLLPHGFEGMGPEHSSARLERFLMLGAEDNLQVVNLTTPAQYFHCLRRQVLRKWRKPLVVMSPKSLLRHPRVVSPLTDLAGGTMRRVLADAAAPAAERVLMCSGKVYYELLEERSRRGLSDRVAILRLEQLYPLADAVVADALAGVADEVPVWWVQEEPENMGAWRYLRVRFGERLLGRWLFTCVSRPASASPATGSHAAHRLEQSALLDRALGGL